MGAVAGRPRRLGELQHAAADAELEHAMQLSTGSNGRYNYSVAETGSDRQARHRGADREPALSEPRRRRPVPRRERPGLRARRRQPSLGNIFSGRYEFGDNNSLTGLFMNSTRNTNIVCLRYNGDPGDDAALRLRAEQQRCDQRAALLAHRQRAARRDAAAGLDLFDRLERLARPAGALRQRRAVAERLLERHALDRLLVNATLPAKERHTISIQAYGTSSQLRPRR